MILDSEGKFQVPVPVMSEKYIFLDSSTVTQKEYLSGAPKQTSLLCRKARKLVFSCKYHLHCKSPSTKVFGREFISRRGRFREPFCKGKFEKIFNCWPFFFILLLTSPEIKKKMQFLIFVLHFEKENFSLLSLFYVRHFSFHFFASLNADLKKDDFFKQKNWMMKCLIF